MLKNPQKTGETTENWAKNGRFPPNARFNGLARFKTGDLATLVMLREQEQGSPDSIRCSKDDEMEARCLLDIL